MSVTPDPYGYSSPSPWWAGKFSGTSGGVKLSLVTDQRSEKPSFWEPRPGITPASASAVTARPSGSFLTSPSPSPSAPAAAATVTTTPAANTRSLDSIRNALSPKDQHKQHVPADSDSNSNSNSNSGSKDTTSPFARQWKHRDTQSTPGTPTSASATHHHPQSQSYAQWRRGGRGRGRGGWQQGLEPHLNVRAQEFVPGRGPPAPTEGPGVDLNEYMRVRAGSSAGTETIGSSRVSVFGSSSRSHTPSEAGEERDVRCTERERAEAERQWHLQTSWDDEEKEKAGDEWAGGAPGVVEEKGPEVREEVRPAGEVGFVWEGGVVPEPEPEPVEDPAPPFVKLPPPRLLPPTPKVEAQIASLPLPFGFLLERAKMIQEGARVPYPQDIKGPGIHASSAKAHRLCYDRDFLLQFQNVCTGHPISVPSLPPLWRSILRLTPPYESRPTPVRTKNKWVQASPVDAAPLQARPEPERRTADAGVETNQPSIDATSTTRIVDAVYNQLRVAPDYPERQLSLGGTSPSSFGERTCRATPTPTKDESLHGFEYEVQEAQRERLEARVEFLAAEVKILRLELARIRKVVG